MTDRILKPVTSDESHKAALREISVLMGLDPAPGTPDGDHLEALSILVQAYESKVPDAAAHADDKIDSILRTIDRIARGYHHELGLPMFEPTNDIHETMRETVVSGLAEITAEQFAILKFLAGEAPYEGVWFGGKPTGARGEFWWREVLRKAFPNWS